MARLSINDVNEALLRERSDDIKSHKSKKKVKRPKTKRQFKDE